MPHGLNFRLMCILVVFVIPAAVYAARTPTAATLVAIRSELTSGSVIWNGAPAAPYKGQSRMVVQATNDDYHNGDMLLSAYNYARTLRPKGQDRSTTNRLTILLPWTAYYFIDTPLTMDAEFVDLVGITQNDRLFPYNNPSLNSFTTPEHRWTLRQTANDVRIENLTIDGRGHMVMSPYAACYWPDANTTQTVMRNCSFGMDRGVRSMREGVDFAGYYENCQSCGYSFGYGANASGTFVKCRAGASFGNGGDASGTFVDCEGGSYSFGYRGAASGQFTRCKGGDSCFGFDGVASGTFVDCEGEDYCFGSGGGVASGAFTRCKAKKYAFGEAGKAIGQFVDCAAEEYAFGVAGLAGGTFTGCKAGHHAFGAGSRDKAGTTSGTFTNCVAGAFSFASTDNIANPRCTLGGTFVGCSAGKDSFGAFGAATAGATLQKCSMNGSWTGGVWAGSMQGCNWGGDIKCAAGARIAGSTVAGTIDLDNKAAGVTQTRARAIVNDGSNVFVRPAPPR